MSKQSFALIYKETEIYYGYQKKRLKITCSQRKNKSQQDKESKEEITVIQSEIAGMWFRNGYTTGAKVMNSKGTRSERVEITTVGGGKWHFTDILNNTAIFKSWKLLGHFQQERRWEGLEE